MIRLTDQLLTVARTYAEVRSLSLSRVSTLALNEGKKLSAIAERGADLSTARFEGAMSWFSENWPADTAWPLGVDRPQSQRQFEAVAS